MTQSVNEERNISRNENGSPNMIELNGNEPQPSNRLLQFPIDQEEYPDHDQFKLYEELQEEALLGLRQDKIYQRFIHEEDQERTFFPNYLYENLDQIDFELLPKIEFTILKNSVVKFINECKYSTYEPSVLIDRLVERVFYYVRTKYQTCYHFIDSDRLQKLEREANLSIDIVEIRTAQDLELKATIHYLQGKVTAPKISEEDILPLYLLITKFFKFKHIFNRYSRKILTKQITTLTEDFYAYLEKNQHNSIFIQAILLHSHLNDNLDFTHGVLSDEAYQQANAIRKAEDAYKYEKLAYRDSFSPEELLESQTLLDALFIYAKTRINPIKVKIEPSLYQPILRILTENGYFHKDSIKTELTNLIQSFGRVVVAEQHYLIDPRLISASATLIFKDFDSQDFQAILKKYNHSEHDYFKGLRELGAIISFAQINNLGQDFISAFYDYYSQKNDLQDYFIIRAQALKYLKSPIDLNELLEILPSTTPTQQ